MNFSLIVTTLAQGLWTFPMLIGIFAASVFMSFALNFVQFRYLLTSISILFKPANIDSSQASKKSGELTAFQAFINTLGANIGNGSLAGIPVAICTGGPGSIFWLLVISTFAVSLRYAEVYLSMAFIGKHRFGNAQGGPMVYLSKLPAGPFLAYSFALFCLGYAILNGNIVQCNSVGVALQRTWGIDPSITAWFLLAFIVYVLIGGSGRIIKYLDLLVPFKVALFVGSCLYVLIYNYQAVPHAFYLIFSGAFYPQAFIGGSLGYAIQQVIAVGLQRSITINEAGLGTAAVAFGSTSGENAVKDSLLSMLSVYINIHIICLMIGVAIISSGVWNNGETSTALMISVYETAFGSIAGWIISFLSINFAVSVLVSCAYLGKVCWSFLTGGSLMFIFPIIYAAAAFFGTSMTVGLAWQLGDIVNAGLFVLNIVGLLWFAGMIRQGLKDYENRRA